MDRDSPDTLPAVEFAGVTKHFGTVRALNEASFTVSHGEVVALLGPNGAGKSTVVDILLGLRRADTGTVKVLGHKPGQAVHDREVGAMLQRGGLPVAAKVGEIVDTTRRLYGNVRTTAEILEMAQLSDLAKRRTDQLSGGQAQRVRFAMAISGKPKLLFLDEPTVALDVEARRHFWTSVRSLSDEGTTIVFATHYLEEADQQADRVIMMNRGRVLVEGPPSQIKAMATVRSIRFTDPDADRGFLSSLAGVAEVEIHGGDVLLRSRDADRTVAELYSKYEFVKDIEVAGADLEDALIRLTTDANEADDLVEAGQD
jgi:ABC-2 type transport system ATP-binding protein